MHIRKSPVALVPVAALCVAAYAGSVPVERQARTHRVRMLQQGTRFLFEPAGLRIRAGDTVEFVNVNGFPHNVQFYPNRIPEGAAEVLNRIMPNRMGPLAGPLMSQPGTYRVTFEGVPEGTYDYMCLPHEALGMKATLIIGSPGGPGSTINDGEPRPDQVPARPGNRAP